MLSMSHLFSVVTVATSFLLVTNQGHKTELNYSQTKDDHRCFNKDICLPCFSIVNLKCLLLCFPVILFTSSILYASAACILKMPKM